MRRPVVVMVALAPLAASCGPEDMNPLCMLFADAGGSPGTAHAASTQTIPTTGGK